MEREASKKAKNYQELSEEDDHDSRSEGNQSEDSCLSEDKSSPDKPSSSRPKKNGINQNTSAMSYVYTGHWKENHGHPLFGISINHHLQDPDPVVFATVGYNR